MEKFFAEILRLKIPTLALIVLFMIVGGSLIKASATNLYSLVMGMIILVIGIFLGIFFFADYRSKEHLDYITDHYKKALDSISKTHSIIEKNNQKNTLSRLEGDIGGPKRKYSDDSDRGTMAD